MLTIAAATLLLQLATPPPVSAPPVSAPPPSAPPPSAPPPSAPSSPPRAGRVVTLDQALRAAEARQPTLRRAAVAVELAQARADEARAPLLPQATASTGYTRQTANTFARPGVASVAQRSASFDTYGTFNFGLTVSQTIWDFGQSYERFRAARATIDVQREAEENARVQAILAVRAAYFGARAQKALASVAREGLANQDRHLGQIQGFVEVGTRPAIDLAQARTDRANAELQLITAENGYEVAKAQLAQAMGVMDGAPFDVADEAAPVVEGEDGPTDALVARALAARPELKGLVKQEQAQELTIRSTKGGYGPTLAAQTGATLAGTDLTALAPNWNAGVTLTWPVFQGLATVSQVREAEATLRDVKLQREGLALQVRLDVEQARLAVRASKASIRAAGDALLNARERLRLAEGRYQAGAGNVIELGDAQTAATQAGAQVVKAEYDLAAARAQLLAALGAR
jgi:outer membrane protein